MAVKKASPPVNNFPITLTITQYSKELIHKLPGICQGNLEYCIRNKIPNTTRIDIELAFIQLLKENYFFSYESSVYPPNKVDENVKTLTKFIYYQKLSFTDYGILYELYKSKQEVNNLSKFSRKILSQGWSEDEREIKNRIGKFFLKGILIGNNKCININWEPILEGIP
jgi:hypothetical protein